MSIKISENYVKLIRTFIDEINNAPDEAFDGKTYAEYYATMSEDSKRDVRHLLMKFAATRTMIRQTAT